MRREIDQCQVGNAEQRHAVTLAACPWSTGRPLAERAEDLPYFQGSEPRYIGQGINQGLCGPESILQALARRALQNFSSLGPACQACFAYPPNHLSRMRSYLSLMGP